MIWILLALLGPLFLAGSNILDKYALDKVSRGSYDFLFFSTIGGFFTVGLTLFVFGLEQISAIAFIPVIAGFFLQYSYLFYYAYTFAYTIKFPQENCGIFNWMPCSG